MPSVYRLTSPSGKSYIGQTTQDFNTRWSQHKKISNTHCRALKAALIKYGPNTFKTEVLLECDDDQLDMFETKMIKLYNTLSPNGYNLDEGGSARRNFTDETKKLMRASAKNASKFIEHNKNLPDYVSVVSNDSKIIGYRIAHHPKCKDTYFKNSKKSTDENLADTLEFLKKVINDESPKKKRFTKIYRTKREWVLYQV